MNIVAVRGDGALLVTAGGQAAVIVSDDGLWPTTRGAALARGEWSTPSGEVIPLGVRDRVNTTLVELTGELDVGSPTTGITAGGEPHSGAMIALRLSDADARRVAVDGGESVDELHLTLGYLGEAALIPLEVQHDLVDCVSECAKDWPTVVGDAFAVALFNPDHDEPCVVIQLGGGQLQAIHSQVMWDVRATLEKHRVPLVEQHTPWFPHITLIYTDDADISYFTDRVGPVTFDAVRLAFGGEVYDVPLGDAALGDEDEEYEYEYEYEYGGDYPKAEGGDESVYSSITATFDPRQPRDAEGQWTKVPGKSLPELLHKVNEAQDGQILARTTNGEERVRVTRTGNYLNPIISAIFERRDAGEWKEYDQGSSYEAVKKLQNEGDRWEVTTADNTTVKIATPATSQRVTTSPKKSVSLPKKTTKFERAGTYERLNYTTALEMQAQMGSWTKSQKMALNDYASDGFINVNAVLRGQEQTTPAIKKQIADMRSAMKPIPKNVMAYRGTTFSALGAENADEMKKLIGKTLQDDGFPSTSVSKSEAFKLEVRAEIEVPRGTKAAFISEVSNSPDELELLLDAGTKYVVQDVVLGSDRWVVKLRVVS